MDRKNIGLIIGFIALGILVVSVPATYIWGDQTGAILRWVGVGVGMIYLVMHWRNKKDQTKNKKQM